VGKHLAERQLDEYSQPFLHLQIDEITIDGKLYKKEALIFPRYHQLQAVRKIIKTQFGERFRKQLFNSTFGR
jgi:hypothetical protein